MDRLANTVRQPIYRIVAIWLTWALILIGYQAYSDARLNPQTPDYVLPWTPIETSPGSQSGKIYLNEPFMNRQVAWDSEYYLSIATAGYEDPDMWSLVSPDGQVRFSGNYAFFPLYPFMIRVVRLPLLLLGLTPIATSTLGGVIVSLLGTLGAMLALYDITCEELDDDGGIRAAFYLLIYPAGFFLAMVYTEGLFAGLAFGSMALIRRQRWILAALLAALAVWTRAVGVALIIPLATAWVQEVDWKNFTLKPFPWRLLGKALLVLAPLVAYWLWRRFFNIGFSVVEHYYFGRELFKFSDSYRIWSYAASAITGSNSQMAAYYLLEFAAMIFGTVACLLTMRRYPGISLFGLMATLIAVTSVSAQGMLRYAMAAPSMFIVLSRAGRSQVFDRAWTVASTLLMGLYAMLFAFNFWAG